MRPHLIKGIVDIKVPITLHYSASILFVAYYLATRIPKIARNPNHRPWAQPRSLVESRYGGHRCSLIPLSTGCLGTYINNEKYLS